MSSPSSSMDGDHVSTITRKNLDAMQRDFDPIDGTRLHSAMFGSRRYENPQWPGYLDDTLMSEEELYRDAMDADENTIYTSAQPIGRPTASETASEDHESKKAVERERQFVKDWLATSQASSATPELVKFAESNGESSPGIFGKSTAAYIAVDEDEADSDRPGYGVFDIEFLLSRIAVLTVPHASPETYHKDILITDILAKALVLQSQAEFEPRAIHTFDDVRSVLANSLKALAETGYTDEGLTRFIGEQDRTLEDPKARVTWSLESKMDGIRRCHITVSPPTDWTPVDCTAYKLTNEEKFDALQQLTEQGRADNLPMDWHDVQIPTRHQYVSERILLAALHSRQ